MIVIAISSLVASASVPTHPVLRLAPVQGWASTQRLGTKIKEATKIQPDNTADSAKNILKLKSFLFLLGYLLRFLPYALQ